MEGPQLPGARWLWNVRFSFVTIRFLIEIKFPHQCAPFLVLFSLVSSVFDTDFQIQCIVYGKQQNPDCAVRIAIKRLL